MVSVTNVSVMKRFKLVLHYFDKNDFREVVRIFNSLSSCLDYIHSKHGVTSFSVTLDIHNDLFDNMKGIEFNDFNPHFK